MKLLDSLKSVFSGSPKPLVLEDITSAEEVFRQERSKKLDEIDRKANKLREEADEKVKSLQEDLEDLEDFEDPKDRAIIEDNIANFVEERQRLLEDFQSDQSIEELHAELEELLGEFNSTNEKRGKVLEEANVGNEFSGSLKDLTDLEKRVEEFIEKEYITEERLEDIKVNVEKIKQLKGELEELNEEKSSEADRLREELENKRQEIEQLENSSLKEEFGSLKSELEDTEAKRDEILQSIGQAMGLMERGLKKMLHEAKVDKVSTEGSEALRDIRDGEKQELLNRDPEVVEEATESLEKSIDGDFLDSTTRQRLTQGISYFRNFSEKKQELNDAQRRINGLEDRLNGHEYRENMDKLEKEEEELERKLENAEREKGEIEGERERIRSEIESREEEIIQVMEAELGREVILES